MKTATKSSLTREINFLTREIELMNECYYVKNWSEYLGEPLYPRLNSFKIELFRIKKERENLEPQYYFKFGVYCRYREKKFDDYNKAKKEAEKSGEKIYHQIFNSKNPYKEIVAEFTLSSFETPETIKEQENALIKEFYIIFPKATPEANLNGTQKK